MFLKYPVRGFQEHRFILIIYYIRERIRKGVIIMVVDYKPYEDEATELVHLLKPHISRSDIREAVKYSMQKRYKSIPCVLDNNYTHRQTEGTLLEMANYINSKEPICTAYGVLFKKHGDKIHPLLDMIRDFMESRDVYKAQMFKFLDAHDYINVAKYNLLQLLN